MTLRQRLGWLLLGLLLLVGGVHAPLHDVGQDCGPWSLCSGALVLMVVAAAFLLLQVSGLVKLHKPRCVLVPRSCPGRERRGRAPPQ